MKELPKANFFLAGDLDKNTIVHTLDQVIAIQRQAYEDGLRDARKVVSAEEILDTEDNADDAYNCGVLDCVRAIDKLTASQKEQK